MIDEPCSFLNCKEQAIAIHFKTNKPYCAKHYDFGYFGFFQKIKMLLNMRDRV